MRKHKQVLCTRENQNLPPTHYSPKWCSHYYYSTTHTITTCIDKLSNKAAHLLYYCRCPKEINLLDNIQSRGKCHLTTTDLQTCHRSKLMLVPAPLLPNTAINKCIVPSLETTNLTSVALLNMISQRTDLALTMTTVSTQPLLAS